MRKVHLWPLVLVAVCTGCPGSSTPGLNLVDVSGVDRVSPNDLGDTGGVPDVGIQDGADPGVVPDERMDIAPPLGDTPDIGPDQPLPPLDPGPDVFVDTADLSVIEVAGEDVSAGEADVTWPQPMPCGPCRDDKDCEGVGRCVDLGYSVGVCAEGCGPAGECFQDFLCEDVPAVSGEMTRQCVPADRCPCGPALRDVTIDCSISNEFGKCYGVERCDGEEWLTCDAQVPAAEACNNRDDDCDGLTDETFGTLTCGLGVCYKTVKECLDGILQVCDPMEGAQAEDLPDGQALDTDCDGVDGTVALSIFVSATTGNDANPGTMDQPKKTITAGLLAAVQQGKRDVLVSEGDYLESVTLADGVGLHGGYRAAEGWRRYTKSVATVMGGTVALKAVMINKPTRISQMVFVAKSGSAPGEHSIGVWVANSTGLVFEQCVFRAGVGAPGAPGANGQPGAAGANGGSGGNGCEADNWPCQNCSQPAVGVGGASACGRTGGNGGAPGHGGQAGKAGQDGCCTTPGGAGGAVERPGQNGQNGANGSDGVDGIGGQAFLVVDGTGITAGRGTDGTAGGNGQGGGGGGGGGGHPTGCDDYGGAGGGGGGGGCGGLPGLGGGAGGSSIAVVSWQSSAHFIGCSFQSSNGGPGGSGGVGGAGGSGGTGGNGGGGHEGSGPGGKGGNGGRGGRGGHGGGGAGGSSIGLLCSGTLVPIIESPAFTTGFAGAGGLSQGDPGDPGIVANSFGCGG